MIAFIYHRVIIVGCKLPQAYSMHYTYTGYANRHDDIGVFCVLTLRALLLYTCMKSMHARTFFLHGEQHCMVSNMFLYKLKERIVCCYANYYDHQQKIHVAHGE